MMLRMASESSDEFETVSTSMLKREWIDLMITERKRLGADFRYIRFEAWLEQQGYQPAPEEVPIDSGSGAGQWGRRALPGGRYPWDQWTDGEEWEARQGVDFMCSVASFRSYLYNYALEHGLWVQTKRLSRAEPLVWFQFRKTEHK